MTSDLLQNEVVPEVGSRVSLNGAEYRLTFPMSAVLRYKAKTGDNLFNAGHWTRIDDDPEKLTCLLWCALQEHQPEMKYDDVEKLLNIGTAPLISVALVTALKSYMPLPKKAAEGEAAPDPNVESLKSA